MSGAAPSSGRLTGFPVIVPSPTRIAWPSDVPPLGLTRAIAADAAEWSAVGAWVSRAWSPKTSTPTSTVPGCSSTNFVAAACAAASRVGETSVAAMLFEMSKASSTVPDTRGTATWACGRARPTSRTGRAASSNAYGRWRLSPPPISVPKPAAFSAAARRRWIRT